MRRATLVFMLAHWRREVLGQGANCPLTLMLFVEIQPSVVIGAPLAISENVLDLMRATLARQSSSRKSLLRSRRTTQRTVVIDARPAPLLPQNELLASTTSIFSTTCVLAYLCSLRRSVVIRVRPALSFDQHGLLAPTVCTFLRRLMFILFGRFKKSARL